ncbi:MAG TPA: aldo/keto reductase [Longimicrobiales bacterium]|nr:aldo/keto reductase [Longimicrobiales bacterium]
MTVVERRTLAPGLEISRVITGLWQIADMERDGEAVDLEKTADAMEPYVDAGYTTFDVADHYGSAEPVVGVFRARPGNEGRVQLFTKWVPEPGPVSRRDVREAVDRALERMRSEALDLLQFHAWAYGDPAWLDALFHLQELKDEGLIRHLGLTNFDAAHLAMVCNSGIDVTTNQACYSLLDRRPSRDMTRVCQEHGVHLLAYGTLAGGLLTEPWLGRSEPEADELDTWSQMKYKRFVEAAGGWIAFQQLLQALRLVSLKHRVSMANVASRYVLEQPAVAGIIIGARLGEREHLEDNLRLFDFTLDDQDRAALAPGLEALGFPPGDCGDEYRKPPYLTAAGDLSDHFDAFPSPYPVVGGPGPRLRALSGTVWEDVAGFSRAMRVGNRILVSGTTATHRDRVIGGSDPGSQLHFCVDKIEGALRALGGRIEDVVRTRIYIRNMEQWEEVSRAHGARFGDIRPANTLVQAGIIGDDYLVEMEVEAVTGGR